MSTKTTTASSKGKPAEKAAPKDLREACATGTVRLCRKRKNGTLRSLPYLAPGSDARKEAELVTSRRGKGEPVGAIADDLNLSVATVRRMAQNLELAKAIEAGEYAEKFKPGETVVVLSIVGGNAV